MGLISCPDCGKNVSDAAEICIGCGRPLKSIEHKPEEILPPDFISQEVAHKYESISTKTLMFPIIVLIFVIIANQLFVGPESKPTARPQETAISLEVKAEAEQPAPIPAPTPPPKIITGRIDGYDPATKSIINPINIFKSYENRNLGISGKAAHGEKITILERSGNGVKIKTFYEVTGWVSSWFVKED